MRIAETGYSRLYEQSVAACSPSAASFATIDATVSNKVTLDGLAEKRAAKFSYADQLSFFDFESLPERRTYEVGQLFYELTGYHYTSMPNGKFRFGDDQGNAPDPEILDKLEKLATVFETAKSMVAPDGDWVRIGRNDLLDAVDTLGNAPGADTDYYDWLAYRIKNSVAPGEGLSTENDDAGGLQVS